MRLTLLIHIVGGGLGLAAGYLALYSAKGARLHRRSGRAFVYAMLTMAFAGLVIAAGQGVAPAVNVPAALLTAYLVVTGLTAVRPPARGARRLHVLALLVALGVGLVSLGFGVEALAAGGTRKGMPAFPFLMFGVVGLLAAGGDLRRLRAAPLHGSRRLARHLWRMSFALFIAALSFFLGQADEFPQPIRQLPLLALPVVAVLLTMLFWLWRVRRRTLPTSTTLPIPLTSTLPEESSMRVASLALICLLAPAAVALPQGEPPAAAPAAVEAAPASPLITHAQHVYSGSQNILLAAAESMPEESYGFRPVDTVRSFGQIVGHLADSQFYFCSLVLGEENPAPAVEKTKTAKADLIAALEEAFAHCGRAYAALTAATADETVKLMGRDAPKLGVLNVNNIHAIEHYGNLVTYLRMNGIVPPTSDPELMRRLRE